MKPEDAVHVGDDRRNDIWGARDAGCDAWLWGSDVHSFKEVDCHPHLLFFWVLLGIVFSLRNFDVCNNNFRKRTSRAVSSSFSSILLVILSIVFRSQLFCVCVCV